MIDRAWLAPAPGANEHPETDMWVDEQIWGHRLWDAQSPWLLFLEFLNVASACASENRLLGEDGHRFPFLYKPQQRMFLRNILFNNDMMLSIGERFPDNASAWKEWLSWMEKNAKGVELRDFSYLRVRFPTFRQFATLVAMLRDSGVESDTNRRWSSRFAFPVGPNALYEDVNVAAGGSVSREYINFGRTGELLYLMMCRSKKASILRPYLATLLSSDSPWNSVLGLLQPVGLDNCPTRGKSYLPYAWHPRFDCVTQDWSTVLGLGLPGFDALPHLVTLGAFHVFLYQLDVASEWLDSPIAPHFVCEVVAPRKTLVRELSSVNYQHNAQLPSLAVEALVAGIARSEAWMRAEQHPAALSACLQLLRDQVRWPGDHDADGIGDAAGLIAELRHLAVSRHRQHVGNVHRNYGRDIGLVSKRGTNRLRYAPTDAFLRSLVLANVALRMEFHEFLACLYRRYGLVFGEREAECVLPAEEYDKKTFQANAARLEQRLGSLGLLRRLSDACAYVQNPFGRAAI